MGQDLPPPEFFEELAEAFRRYQPIGSHQWNFGAAFGMLERVGSETAGWEAGSTELAGPREASLAERLGLGRHRSPREQERPAVDDTRRAVAESVEATLSALRFLAARVDQLERRLALERRPVEATEWLLDPPSLEGWVGPVGDWIAGTAPHGGAVVGECGAGELAAELAGHGLEVRGIEPRAPLAWRAAARGVAVTVRPVPDALAEVAPGTLGAVVLTDVVDRLDLGDLAALLDRAVTAAAPRAPVVVLGRDPGCPLGPGAGVLPGRPLPPDTWAVLLEKLGLAEVEWLTDEVSPAGEAVHWIRGRRPA